MSNPLVPVSNAMRLLGLIQKEFPNYHPVIAIARIAHHEDADLKLQLEAHKAVAKYVEPELKSVEVRNTLDARMVRVSLFDPVTLDSNGNVLENKPEPENW